jgi:hypothetical protein
VIKDPLYRKILERLAGPLVPDDFEACMADLLQDAFPGVQPVRGGNDAGMDGSIPDGYREPYPLVCTISDRVERNLGQSLDAFLQRGLTSRKVALATSQALTPAKRRELHQIAREKGFTLTQIIDRDGVASLLYRHPAWRRVLIELPGHTSALSVIPLTRRPLMDLKPIGRDADMQWLRETKGDRILSGEPGSGKTFLLHHLMLNGWDALFLTESDEGRISDAMREQAPKVIVVDDAHATPEVLVRLRRLREEVGSHFDLLAVTWEGAKDQVGEALGGIPRARTHQLELLTRNEILEVVRQAGVEASDAVLRELVSQAANKPGLAVTIATLWKQGAWQEILDGTVLRRTLLTLFQDLVGQDTTPLLASFSLGGDAGMELGSAAEFLGLNRSQAWRLANGLAAGGVLSSLGASRLAVRPEVLRSALLRAVFFPDSGAALDYSQLLEKAPDRARAIESVVTARLYGARVTDQHLRELVASINSRKAWQGLAATAENNALWALDNYPGDGSRIATAALQVAPEPTVRYLLEKAVGATEAPEAQAEHPMSILGDWMHQLDQRRPNLTIHRRRAVVHAAKEFWEGGGPQEIGIQAIALAITPRIESHHLDPGAGQTMLLTWGQLSLAQLQEIGGFWDHAKGSITSLHAGSWKHLSAALWGWIYPEHSFKSTNVDPPTRRFMHDFVAKVLRDLSSLSKSSPGLTEAIRRLGEKIDLEMGAPDSLYAVLFPADFDGRDLEAWHKSQLSTMKAIAQRWSERSHIEVIGEICIHEIEAQQLGHAWPRNTPMLCREIASVVDEPELWVSELMKQGAPGDLVLPFLERATKLQRPNWKLQVDNCLQMDRYTGIALDFVLRMQAPPSDLLQKALEVAPAFPSFIETLCLRNEVPVSNLRELLNHPDKATALSAAVGEWLAEPQGQVRQDLMPDWRSAVLRPGQADLGTSLNHWLGGILTQDSDLAFEWCRQRVRDTPEYKIHQSSFATAVSRLSRQDRIRLLNDIDSESISYDILGLIVGKDPSVYKELLSRPGSVSLHLEPLQGPPDDSWLQLAILALDAGHTPQKVAVGTISTPHSWWGSGKEYWLTWDQAFSHFENHARQDIREVAQHGRQMAQEEIVRANQRARHLELHGL